MVDVQVEFEYTAQEDDELTLHVGEIISNVNKMDGGWWEGELNGKKGVFPDNFVKEIKKDAKKEQKGHVANMAHNLNKTGGIKMGQPPPGPVVHRNQDAQKKKTRAKVTFSYTPEHEDELRLEVGETVEIVKQAEEGWWEGQLDGKTGVFPSNFVELLDDNGELPAKAKKDDGAVKEIPGKKVRGVGLGNIFSDGPIKLRSTAATKDAKDKPKEEEAPKESQRRSIARGAPPPVPREAPVAVKEKPVLEKWKRFAKSVKKVERAKVLFDYEAENEDELSIREGDTIIILEKELEDSGWWKGELNGKVGVFPDNFVDILPSEEPKPRKPPPPVVPLSNNKAKLDRPAPPDPVKPEPKEPERPAKRKEDDRPARPEKPAGPVPSKKPVAPATGKKPGKATDPKLIAQTDDHKAREHLRRDPPPVEEHDLDAVESKEKLSHPTASRARVPAKRPPSLHHRDSSQGSPEVDRKSITRGARPTPQPPKEERHSQGVDSSVVADLRQELQLLRQNTVPKQQYEGLQHEVQGLREAMDLMKTQFNKRLYELMNEIDEEKKVKMSIQVEMERVKKLLQQS